MTESSERDRPDVITVVAEQEETVRATHVELQVTVRGSSLVSGRAALRRAKEIAAVVEKIVPEFVAEDDVHVRNVRAQVSGGVLGRSSSASRRRTIANLPFRAASISAVWPSWLWKSIATPIVRSRSTTFSQPLNAAHIRGFSPFLSGAAGSAPRSRQANAASS